MSTSFSQYHQNIQRQAREQRAMGSILSGVAIALISSILLVAILASFGGWVLWRQIQKQSTTVTQLESRMNDEVQVLRASLKETVAVVDQLNAQGQAQKQQIAWLQNQAEDVRKQARADRAALQARVQKVETRIYDLERRANWSR